MTSFCHSVWPLGLQLQGGRESVVGAHVGADSNPESSGKLRSAVGDNIVRYAMFPHHVLTEPTCQFRSVDNLTTG